jgi:hypothetical protein
MDNNKLTNMPVTVRKLTPILPIYLPKIKTKKLIKQGKKIANKYITISIKNIYHHLNKYQIL